ncbi:MAG: fumarylpyruvate hydrolase [Parasphingorhabdus sp.]|jgi:fumarylpyruvate hydrolase
MNTVFELPSVTVPVVGRDEEFPVRRIYCVGRNYAAHAREMGFDPDRDPPFFFCKPADAILYCPPGESVSMPFPSLTENLQHEIELVVAIGKQGSEISLENANQYIWGYGLGLDMTRRDLQINMREKGRPWEIGKAFDHGAPMGPLHAVADTGILESGEIFLQVNGSDRQRSNVSHLIWSIPEVIANLSTLFELHPGDLIFSGTPEGVSKLQHGDQLRGGFDGLGDIQVNLT